MNNDVQQQQENGQDEQTASDELKQYIVKFFYSLQAWMRPNKQQPLLLQVLFFILKLPILILMLVLSPVVLIVLLFVFFAVL